MESESNDSHNEEESTRVMRPAAQDDGDTPDTDSKKRSSKRDLWKKKRNSNKRYLTQLVDSLSYATLTRKKPRAKSCERDESMAKTSSVSNPDKVVIEKQVIRPDSGYAEGGPLTFPVGRRYSEQISTSSTTSGRVCMEQMTHLSIDEATPEEKYLKKAGLKVKELVAMEKTYVEKSLHQVVNGYKRCMDEAKTNPEANVKIPVDLLGGKDRIIFGNIVDLFEFHKESIYPVLMKAEDDPKVLLSLFQSKQNVMKQKYGRFCLNKPKSEYIISQHNDKYFAVLRLKHSLDQALSPLMMTPVQQVTRYQLLLSEIEKCYRQAGHTEMADCMKKAHDISHRIVEYANDMMTAGRINGFNEDVTSQGLLLARGNAICYKRRSALKKPKIKHCHVFVFQETIIICEDLEFQSNGHSGFPQSLEYFASFKMNKVLVREITKNNTTFGFELERQDKSSKSRSGTKKDEELNLIVVQCESEAQRDKWLKTINDQIRDLKDIARRLVNPQHFLEPL